MISIKNLTYKYDEKTVLNGLNLDVMPAEKIGIVGESGSGKTTLIKLISGLYKVQVGTITVEGKTAVVMQSQYLFPLTIRENITCEHEISEAVIQQAVKIAQLEDWISSLPDGLDTFTGIRGGQVSGGQAQRISIARAIAFNPDILILDEATSALDKKTAAKLMEAISVWWKDKTVISIAHRAEALNFCQKIYRLEDGELKLIKNQSLEV